MNEDNVLASLRIKLGLNSLDVVSWPLEEQVKVLGNTGVLYGHRHNRRNMCGTGLGIEAGRRRGVDNRERTFF